MEQITQTFLKGESPTLNAKYLICLFMKCSKIYWKQRNSLKSVIFQLLGIFDGQPQTESLKTCN